MGKAAQSAKLYTFSKILVLLKCMIDNFGTLNLIKLILDKFFCFFVFSMISVALLIVNSEFKYYLCFHMLNAMEVSILLKIFLLYLFAEVFGNSDCFQLSLAP